jgi:hypothetical protein
MAGELNIKFLVDSATLKKGLKKSQNQLSGFEKTTKKITGGIGKALGGIGLALGVGALVGGLKEATKAAAEDAREQRLLAEQMRTTLGATKDQIAGTEDYITKLSLQTGILDGDLRPALSNAIRGTGNLQDAQKLLEVALDGSAASGKSVDTVMQALIKAQNGNTTSLYKLAPQLKKTKGGIDDYARSVEGAAEVSADPFAKLNVATKELQEQLGNILLPYVQKFAEYMIEEIVPAIDDFFKKINNPNSEEGKIFLRLKDLAEDFWDTIQKIAKSQGFKTTLEGVLIVAEKLLQVLEDISDLDAFQKETTNQLTAKIITSNPFATIEDIQNLGKTVGLSLSRTQAARAKADYLGGADGDPDTPWPMAKGGVVMPRPGGTLARIGEAGKPEAVIPLDRMGDMMGGNTYIININKASITGQEIVTAIQRYERGSGRRVLLNG